MIDSGIHHSLFLAIELDGLVWIVVVFFWMFANIFAGKNKKKRAQKNRSIPRKSDSSTQPVFSEGPVVKEKESAIPLERDLREFLETVRKASQAANEPVRKHVQKRVPPPPPKMKPKPPAPVVPPPAPAMAKVEKKPSSFEPMKEYEAINMEEPSMQSYTLMRTQSLSVGLSLSMKNIGFTENLHIHSNAGRKAKFLDDMRSKKGLQKAIYHSLILGPPKAYGDDWDGLKKFGGV